MIMLPETAVTDFYSHSETDEDVMRESWNTMRPVGAFFGFFFFKENIQEVLKAKNLTKNYANMTPADGKLLCIHLLCSSLKAFEQGRQNPKVDGI